MTSAIATRADELATTGVPFVQATVVRAQEPSSARPGDRAIILADGSMEGFVGGDCAAGSVRTAALDVLGSGRSLLLRVLPDRVDTFPDAPGATVVVNPCLSGGALEIYLEPLLPRPVVGVVGTSPTADAVAEVAAVLGYDVRRADAPGGPAEDGVRPAAAVVICSHGGDEAAEVRSALDAGVGFVGVVCSRTRGAVLMAALALPDEQAARVHPHVGVDIGARTAAETGLSIMAAVVRAVRVDGLTPALADTPAAPIQVVDPVCGMTVTVGPRTPHAVVGGVDHWFCCLGCRDRYVGEQA